MAKNTRTAPIKWNVSADNSGLSSKTIQGGIDIIEAAAPLVIDDEAGPVYSSAKIYSMLPDKTVSGAVANFSDAIPELPIVEGTFNIDANLDGITEVTISNDTEDVTVTLPDPCYGGTVQTDGTVTITYIHIVVDGINIKTSNVGTSSGKTYFVVRLDDIGVNTVTGDGSLLCDNFEAATGAVEGHCYVTGTGALLLFYLEDQTITTKNDADLWFQEHNTNVTYLLSTPYTGTPCTPFTIKTLPGVETTNSISCDTGDSSVTYKSFVPRPE